MGKEQQADSEEKEKITRQAAGNKVFLSFWKRQRAD